MIRQLNIEEFLQQSAGHLTLDVRSEAEYDYGHILHATSLPLFNNDERKLVGTTYKQKGKNDAVLQGLDMVGPKMSGFIRFVQDRITDNTVFVHCWRGGMRSGSMAWLLNQFGYQVNVLTGGYKAYRHYVLQQIALNYKLVLLGGKTGSCKTSVLKQLGGMGEQVIDLEALANHRGSAFGALGLPAQPSTEHFENLLADALLAINPNKRVWVEDESKTIGRVFLDNNWWKSMRQSAVFVIDLPLEVRLKRLLLEYGQLPKEGLEAAITNIQRRLGNEQFKAAIAALNDNDLATVANIALYYYDKAYEKGIAMKDTKEVYRYAFSNDNIEQMAATLVHEADAKNI